MKFFLYILFFSTIICINATAQNRGISKGIVTFSKKGKIDKVGYRKLDSLADYLLYNPLDKAVIAGSGNSSKLDQQTSWDRTNAAIEYLAEKRNISRDRCIFQYAQAGPPNTVSFRIAENGEDGPSMAPPPFPNLRRD